MQPANLLFILSDEHNPRVLGAAGHPMIKTPNLDRLAAAGVRFTGAYCNSPICVPSRAALATGRYVHRTRFWDNAIAYDGSVPSWHHRLRDAGHEVVSIGKLHFRSADDDNGFTEEVMPLHIVDGIGDPLGWLRDYIDLDEDSDEIGPALRWRRRRCPPASRGAGTGPPVRRASRHRHRRQEHDSWTNSLWLLRS